MISLGESLRAYLCKPYMIEIKLKKVLEILDDRREDVWRSNVSTMKQDLFIWFSIIGGNCKSQHLLGRNGRAANDEMRQVYKHTLRKCCWQLCWPFFFKSLKGEIIGDGYFLIQDSYFVFANLCDGLNFCKIYSNFYVILFTSRRFLVDFRKWRAEFWCQYQKVQNSLIIYSTKGPLFFLLLL